MISGDVIQLLKMDTLQIPPSRHSYALLVPWNEAGIGFTLMGL